MFLEVGVPWRSQNIGFPTKGEQSWMILGSHTLRTSLWSLRTFGPLHIKDYKGKKHQMIFSHNGRPIQENLIVFDIQSSFAYQVPWSWCLPCSDPALQADQRPIRTRAMPLLGGNGQYHGFLVGLDCQTLRCSSFPVVLLVLLPSLLSYFRCLTLFDRWVII